MSATFIPALVIKHNNDVYLTPELVVGVSLPIPTPGSGGVIDGDYWAVPISDNGIVTGFNFEPTTPDNIDFPTEQSFHVFRLITRFGNDVWYVRGSTTFDGESPANPGYIQAAQDAECCAADPVSLPTDVPELFPCQTACEFDADNNYFFVLQTPTLQAGQNWVGNGYLNGEVLPEITANTVGALETALDGNWTGVGSPAVTIAWQVLPTGQIIGTIADGDGTDTLCSKIVAE